MKLVISLILTFITYSIISAQTPEPLILEVEEVPIAGTDEISCHLFCSNFEQIASFQFSIVWDTLELQYMRVDSFGPSNIFHNLYYETRPGSFPPIWASPIIGQCEDLEDGSRIISLRFKRLSGIGKFKIMNQPMAIEVTNCDLEVLDVIFIDNLGGISHVRNGVITNTKELESDKISIYPNPASERIFLNWDQLNQIPDEALFYNLQGKIIGQSMIQDQSIEVPNDVVPGIYFMQLRNSGKSVAVKKVQIQK